MINSKETQKETASALKALSLKEWVFENFQSKYGFKTVSDKKFVQLISTTLKNMHRNARVRLFARFMNLHKDPLDNADLK